MEIAKQIAPIALAIIMFGLGLGLTPNDFKRVINFPKDFLVGFIGQVVLLPIIAFGIVQFINVSPEIALGIMIIASAPGGVTSNVLTKFAGGDVALSISLTAIISLLSIITVPFIVLKSASFIGIDITKEISMIAVALKMFFVVTVPVFFGMIVRSLITNFVISKTLFIQKTSIILFLIVFISIWIEEWDRLVAFMTSSGLVALTLNVIMLLFGYFLAKFFASGIPQRKCISLECGLQNGTLAVVVSTQLFNDIVFLYPTAAYALIMFCTSIIFVLIVRKIN